MTEHSTAKPIYCCTCQQEIILPGQYVIMDGRTYHIGCDIGVPGFANVVVTERDGPSTQGASTK